MKLMVAYVRVSTSQQGRSGLGIEAQREALARFAATERFQIATEFVEVETGKGSDALERRALRARRLVGRGARKPDSAAATDGPHRRRCLVCRRGGA